MSALTFTGERYVPGQTSRRIARDHTKRYEFAISFIKYRRVLDIACGTGYGSAMCAEGGAASVDGVDICAEAVDFAAHSHVHPGLRFIVGDIATYRSPMPYDVILCYETIEHLVDYDAALNNLWLLLKPGGMLLVSSPNRCITSPQSHSFRDAPRNPFHVHEYSAQELRRILVARGFGVTAAAVYGQRQQRTIRSKVLRSAYQVLFATKWTTSANVAPVRDKTPRYIVLIASKCDRAP